jgi:hypothetical protein
MNRFQGSMRDFDIRGLAKDIELISDPQQLRIALFRGGDGIDGQAEGLDINRKATRCRYHADEGLKKALRIGGRGERLVISPSGSKRCSSMAWYSPLAGSEQPQHEHALRIRNLGHL